MHLQGRSVFSKELQVECDCYTHAIRLVKFDDDDTLFLNFWYLGRRNISLRKKLKDVFDVLKGNRMLIEEIVLNKEDVKVLRDYLNEYLADTGDVK
ncbi:MAG: hypothetical protein PWQ37_2860 [Candidatus Petromonas sp.]|nr:hypothetical protein [Candidatus Petromonas sp.]